MKVTISLKDLRENLSRIIDHAKSSSVHYIVKGDGDQPDVMIVNTAEYEALLETIDFLSDEEILASLKKAGKPDAAPPADPWPEGPGLN